MFVSGGVSIDAAKNLFIVSSLPATITTANNNIGIG